MRSSELNIFENSIYYVLLGKCNLNCSHCIRKISTDSIMEISEARRGLQIISDTFPRPISLILTGGEPTLYPNLKTILEYSCSNFDHTIICSNGVYKNSMTSLFQFFAKKLILQISIDGLSSDHNFLRKSNSWKNSFDSLERACIAGIKTVVSTTVNADNINNVLKLGNKLQNYKNIMCWKISPEQTFNIGTEGRRLHCDEWNNFVDLVLNTVKLNVSIQKMYDFSLFKEAEHLYGKDFIKRNAIRNCGFGKKLYVYPDFSLYPCTCLSDFKLGNLLTNSYKEIRNNLNKLLLEKDLTPSICSSCKWEYLCGRGCPGRSLRTFNKLWRGDPICPLVINSIKEKSVL